MFSPQVQAALIGAGVAILTLILKDIILHEVRSRRQKLEADRAVYRKYADPLSESAESLFWRLNEILSPDGRGEYLKQPDMAHGYDKYKFDSTLYRLAAFLGWLRAYRLELALLAADGMNETIELRESIASFTSALADGNHIEEKRIVSIASLCGVTIPENPEARTKLAVKVEQTSKALLGPGFEDLSALQGIDDYKKDFLCKEILKILGVSPTQDQPAADTREGLIKSLAHKEAWLYRDYQNGIGDLMIISKNSGARNYAAIGFKDFEDILHSDDPIKSLWVGRLKRTLHGIDVSTADIFDARIEMFHNARFSLANILISLEKANGKRKIISGGAMEAARTVAEACDKSHAF